ncbi:hypothetical protein M3Y97_00014000 [Aphelenchoides bicaudatus]|nr:hypothetical protein M3Y97_00014000 [Aphelenchoides bicaudatus]
MINRLWLLVMLAIWMHSDNFAIGKQAQVSMCMYNRVLGLSGVNCNDSAIIPGGEEPPVIQIRNKMARDEPIPISNNNNFNGNKNKLNVCSSSAAMIICTKDLANECPESGQVCTLSDRTRCCQNILRVRQWQSDMENNKNSSLVRYIRLTLLLGDRGIPVSYINAKPGECPQPIGISGTPDNSQSGCWLDSNCPGVQKCCLEPNPSSSQSTRICRDPLGLSKKLGSSVCNLPLAVGSCTAPVTRYYVAEIATISSRFQAVKQRAVIWTALGVQGTPLCPADANTNINCLFAHADACTTDQDCLGRENSVQPSCCMTKCGFRICYLY